MKIFFKPILRLPQFLSVTLPKEVSDKMVAILTSPYTDLMRSTNMAEVFSLYSHYEFSNELVKGLSSLSFIQNDIIQNGVKVMMSFAVVLVTAISIWKYTTLQAEVDATTGDVKEVFKRTMITTALIAMFPIIFSIADNIGSNFTTSVTEIGTGTGYEWLSGREAFIFQEPFLIDKDPNSPMIEYDGDGNITKEFNINERCGGNTEQGCKAPINVPNWMKWLVAGTIKNVEYYRYDIDFGMVKSTLWMFTFGNYLIAISVLARAFKVGFLYLISPVTIAFGLTNNLDHIDKNVSMQLYAGVFQVGLQLLAIKLTTILSTQVIPTIFPNLLHGIGWVIVQVVAFFVIIGTPSFINKMIGVGMPVMGKVNIKIPKIG